MLEKKKKSKKQSVPPLHGRLRMYKTCDFVPLTPERRNW